MARALIVGCGCHGRELGEELKELGWRVRGTSRRGGALEPVEGAGIEHVLADPDRPGTILDLCGDVAVVIWLLGSAAGESAEVESIHGPRLERLLQKLVDSPVRGFAYEASGSVKRDWLERGKRAVTDAGERWRIPVAFIDGDRSEPGWARRAAAVTAGLVAG